MPTRSWNSTPASAGSWTSCAKPAWTRTRWFSTRPTTAPGRTSIRTPATRRSAAPRAPLREGGNRVPAIAVWPGKIKPGSKNHEIIGGLDLMATFASVAGRQAARERPRRQADHLRQLRHDAGADGRWQVAAQVVVLLHRERTFARRGPRQQLQVRVQYSWRRRSLDRRAGRRHATLAGRARRSMSPRCPRCSTCGRTRRSATTSS